MGNNIPRAPRRIRCGDPARPTTFVVCCLHLLFSADIWALPGLEERLKARSALQSLSLCLPASPQGRVQQHPQNMPGSRSRKRKLTCNRQQPFPLAVLLPPRCPQGCFEPTLLLFSQPVVLLGLEYNSTMGFSPALTHRNNTGDLY